VSGCEVRPGRRYSDPDRRLALYTRDRVHAPPALLSWDRCAVRERAVQAVPACGIAGCSAGWSPSTPPAVDGNTRGEKETFTETLAKEGRHVAFGRASDLGQASKAETAETPT